MKHQLEKIRINKNTYLVNVKVLNFPIHLFSAWFLAGSRFDPKNQEGMAHLIEHMIGKKIKEFTTETKRLSALESHGIKFNAQTNYETSYFHHIHPPEEDNYSIKTLLKSIFETIFDEKDLEEEKRIVFEEINSHVQDSQEYLWNYSNQNLWPKSNIGRDFFGKKRTINKIHSKDLRIFFNEKYLKGTKVFVFIGNKKTKEIQKIIQENLPKKNEILNKIENKESYKKPRLLSIKKINERENHLNISINFHSLSQKNSWKKIASLNLIEHCLAGGWSSVLNKEMRLKRNLIYWINNESGNFSDTGFSRFIFSCNNKNAKKSIINILKKIDEFKKNPIKISELECYKKSFKSSLLLEMTNPYEIMWWYGWQNTIDEKADTKKVADYLKIINEINPDDILKTSREIFKKENLSISILGNFKEKKELLKLIEKIL